MRRGDAVGGRVTSPFVLRYSRLACNPAALFGLDATVLPLCRRLRRPLLLAALAILAVLPSLAAATATWDPARTHVLIGSVIEWPAKAKLAPFLSERRRDEDLAEQFKACGVPAENVVFLKDAEATKDGIRTALAAVARRAGPGSTLVFYLQGHGSRKVFCSYDSDPENAAATQLHMDEIYPILDPAWQGERLLLIGDYCSSGMLSAVVRQFDERRPNVRAACLASATATNKSTERWTFTANLIRLLAGEGRTDRDGDGVISFAEAGAHLLSVMKYQENQLALVATSKSFEPDFVLRRVAPGQKSPPRLEGKWQVGDVVEAQDQVGKWYASEILDWDAAQKKYRIHFYGWDPKWDEWVEPARVRELVKPKLQVGARYDVQWQDRRWYPGTIVRAVDDWFYFVHYAGEAGEDDEWVTVERTRPPGREVKAEFAPPEPVRALALGQLVAAQWHRQWWRARLTDFEDGLYTVRYDDNTTGRLMLEELLPLASAPLQAGQRVLACWAGKPRMYPGRVVAVAGPKVSVRWEDGTAPTEVSVDCVSPIAD